MKLLTVFIVQFLPCFTYTNNVQFLSDYFQLLNYADNDDVELQDDPSSVSRNYYEIYLDPAQHFRFAWKVDYDNKLVLITVTVTSADDQWIAIGFSDYGNVTEADLCLLWWDVQRRPHFQDVWTDDDGAVHVDKQQDCKLQKLNRGKNGVTFTYSRHFDTCDTGHDYVIDSGTVHVVYVMDDGPIDQVRGLSVLSAQHGFQRAQLLKVAAPPVKFPKATQTFAVLSNKAIVPNVETTYWCRIVKLPKMKTIKHVIQFEAVIEEGHEMLVHHMEVFHCEVKFGQSVPFYDGPCDGPDRPKATQPCKKVIAAWAMGAQPFAYPREAGLPIGGPNYSPFVMLEIHYNNPQLRDDYVDSSGIKFYYTSELRPHDAAVLEVGLEYSNKMAIPPHQPDFTLAGHCVADCTQVALPPTGIILFAAQLHTHLTGKRVVVQHYRGGNELPEMTRDDHYSPHFQEIRTLKNRILLLPGDALVTSCTYDTSQRTNITLGGYAISEEMCVSYIHYFPKSNLEVCKSSIDSDVLRNYFQFLNEYENQPTSAKKSTAENYQSIEWTPLRAQILDKLYTETTLSMQCNQSSGERFPGYWNNMAQTKVHSSFENVNKQQLCDDNDVSSEYNVDGEDNDI